MSSSKGAAQQVDDFYVQLFARGKPQEVEIGAPDNDPVARVIETITESILRYAGTTLKDVELAQLLQPDRVLIRTIPPAGIEALTIWIAPRHVIAVNRGLALFVYRLARALAAHGSYAGRTTHQRRRKARRLASSPPCWTGWRHPCAHRLWRIGRSDHARRKLRRTSQPRLSAS